MSWFLGVQILLPSEPGSLWGVAKWGEAKWSIRAWYDLSSYVTGCTWTRGALVFDGRPDPGVLNLSLRNEGGMFSPLDPSNSYNGMVTTDSNGGIVNYFFSVGTLVRIVAHNPDDATDDGWVPQFTGVVSSWVESQYNRDQYREVNLTVWETISTLANVNTNAIAAEGDDDIVYQRVRRLADAADWQFGYMDETGGEFDSDFLQSTTMAQPRTGDIYLAADSVGATARSDRSGALVVYGQTAPVRGPLETLDLISLPNDDATPSTRIDPEGLTYTTDNQAIINVAEFARVGGTVQTATDELSIGRFKSQYSHTRNDLINKSDVLTLALAESLVDARSQLADRLTPVTVRNLHDGNTEFLVTADVHSVIDRVEVVTATRTHKLVFTNVRIDGMEHTVTPTSAGGHLNWSCTYSLGRSDPPTLETI